ncbi:bile acid:sodium symporter [Microbacterium gilvum]|uniref:Arsenic resistance protein n=1 Tax=Microbacterium gilvum TaxID=1336204 RepID=A0ABP9A228_9MICO
MRAGVEWMERHQVALYLLALAVGAAIGLLAPGSAGATQSAVMPLLGVLLWATFLGVPFARMLRALHDGRFLATILVVNFVLVPIVVLVLSRMVAHDRVLLVGVLFVLLTPCVDYVIVFTGIAGGSAARLLAATPLLMLTQMLLLPVHLRLLVGAEFVEAVDPAPFVEAFLLLIALPLGAAWLTQLAAARTRAGAVVRDAGLAAMVPLMILALAAVVASQIASVGQRIGALLLVVPVFALFAVVMVGVGTIAGRVAGLDAPARRAVVFSGVTRNSLVVLPLVLALPAAFALAPLVVVTQTLVELLVMVVLVRLLPRLIRER